MTKKTVKKTARRTTKKTFPPISAKHSHEVLPNEPVKTRRSKKPAKKKEAHEEILELFETLHGEVNQLRRQVRMMLSQRADELEDREMQAVIKSFELLDQANESQLESELEARRAILKGVLTKALRMVDRPVAKTKKATTLKKRRPRR